MTDALVEKVEMMLFINQDESPRDKAAAVVFTVLDHFSEPGNVTDEMAEASLHALIDFVESEEDNERDKVAAAMRAARDEVIRDK